MINAKNAVVYLMYIPYGYIHFKNFIDSYNNYSAGIDHNFVIVFKDFQHTLELDQYIKYVEKKRIKFSYYLLQKNNDVDIGAYFYIAAKLKNENLFFLNTRSLILCQNWLLILNQSLNNNNIGAVGCTGSWGDFGRQNIYKGSNLLKYLFSIILFYFNYYPRVKEHLRTNSFLINRELFLSLKYTDPKPKILFRFLKISSKYKALCFEHGKNSLTQQLEKRNLCVKVVGKNGSCYTVDAWMDSLVFWNGNQENLMIHDNQTLLYHNSDNKMKLLLKHKAWGSNIFNR